MGVAHKPGFGAFHRVLRYIPPVQMCICLSGLVLVRYSSAFLIREGRRPCRRRNRRRRTRKGIVRGVFTQLAENIREGGPVQMTANRL